MESKVSKRKPSLLPRYFKKIGLLVMIVAFVPAILIKSMNYEIMQSHKELFKIFTFNAFILGLIFIAWSREKIEDEMIVAIRLRTMAWAFAMAVFYVIITPFVDLLFKYPIEDITGQGIVIIMLFSYLFMFYLQRKGR